MNPRSLEQIRTDGLRVSISLGIPGLSQISEDGTASGLDVDFARAVAIAITGTADAITWLPTAPADRIETVATGVADLGCSNTSWTSERDHQALFIGVLCHDGEGFLTSSKVTRLDDLDGATASIQAGTTTAGNLLKLAADRGVYITPRPADTPADALRTYLDGTTECYILDQTALAGIRSELERPELHQILPDTISYEPMAPFVARENLPLFHIARHVLFTLINAEKAGCRAAARERLRAATIVSAQALGLRSDWLDSALALVGDYGAMYEANLGRRSQLMLPRSQVNHHVTAGGAHFAAP